MKRRRFRRPPSNRAWLAAHPQPPSTSVPRYPEEKAVLLRCWNDFWVAGAVWRRVEGQWVCERCAPIIRWMAKLSPVAAKMELLRRGCSWSWIVAGNNENQNSLSQNNGAPNAALGSSSKAGRPLEQNLALQRLDMASEPTAMVINPATPSRQTAISNLQPMV